MLQSQLFSKTRKDAPSDENSKNAKLLIRGGFVHKELAGVYSYLPLGLLVLNKINSIIREEMAELGATELFLSSLQSSEPWMETSRWSDENVDTWFKTVLKNGTELGLGFTHEEPLTRLMLDHVRSFRDLPVCVFQIQTKFRNELRAKSGIMRCREFLMKDLYSFSRDQNEHNIFYEKVKIAYKKIFDRVGIGHKTYLTFASGGTFSEYSHEFQTITDAGEDVIHICEGCQSAINDEIFEKVKKCPQCAGEKFKKEKSVEVGNIFTLGDRFSNALRLKYKNEKGESCPVFMGSYGIGPGRVMGTVVELLGSADAISWPKSISPFSAHLIAIGDAISEAKGLYMELKSKGVEVLFDDRDLRAGEKFADADLIGIHTRIIVSEKNLKEDKIEIKSEGKEKIISKRDLHGIF